VAVNKVCMNDADFKGARGEKAEKAQDVKRQLAASEVRGLRPEVVAPIAEGDTLFGVVSVGGVRQRKGLEKRLLLMVGELAAQALSNSERMRLADESAGHDGMTGLLNRRRVMERLEKELHRAERDSLPLSVLMLDLDHFRQYNENNGHVQGDDVLRQLAQLLRSSVRSDDMVARYAGEEFLVVYPGADKDVAARLAEQLRAAVEAYPFPFRGLQPRGALTVSGGVATYPQDSKIGRELVRCADQALFEAKAAGRNQVAAATPSYLA
jgi:diguanylate cyclase (GGDEF)-like protein